MPWIVADEEGRICHARKKIYNSKFGAQLGYQATLDNYLKCWYLYDDDLDYHFYVKKRMPEDDSFLGQILSQAHPVENPSKQAQRWDELTEQFKSIYTIQEVTVALQSK